MRRAMVLCAGYGTRLAPLTLERPKPLVPLGDRPVLAHVAGRLAAAGFSEVVVNTHHMADEFTGVSSACGVEILVTHEPEILGTAGGVRGALPLLGDPPAVVWNGDVLADVSVADLVRGAPAWARLAVRARPAGEGPVGVDAGGLVTRLRGERFGEEVAGADYVGVAALGRATLDALPARGCLVGDVWLPALRGGARLETLDVRGPWIDVGSLAGYLDAHLAWLAGRGAPSWSAADAEVAPGVELVASVVGAGGRVTGRGVVAECVVWPGATLEAPARRVVATPRAGRVDVPPASASAG